MAQFTLEVSYSQVALFDAKLQSPYNDWTDEHVAQGFAWRPGSVSFGTLDDAGPLAVEAFRTKVLDEASSNATRIIVVPFSVPEHGEIEIASISSDVSITLPPGEYEVTFEHGKSEDQGMWANFYFRAVSAPVSARVIRVDAELRPPTDLVMAAQSA